MALRCVSVEACRPCTIDERQSTLVPTSPAISLPKAPLAEAKRTTPWDPSKIPPESVAHSLMECFGVDDLVRIIGAMLVAKPRLVTHPNLRHLLLQSEQEKHPLVVPAIEVQMPSDKVVDDSGSKALMIQNDDRKVSVENGVALQEPAHGRTLTLPEMNEFEIEEIEQEKKEQEKIIQFSTALYFVSEDELRMIIDVVRLGSLEGTCSAMYETQDGSAKAGQRYEYTTGIVTFGTGESVKQISVEILQDDLWDATLDFTVHLSKPTNANLGRYLWKCRVRVVDDDMFPTNKFQTMLKQDKVHDIPHARLMQEYFRMNLTNPNTKRDSRFILIAHQFKNVYRVWVLFLGMVLIDNVLLNAPNKSLSAGCSDEEEPRPQRILSETIALSLSGDPLTDMLLILLAMVLPLGFLICLPTQSRSWRVGAIARKTLQTNLLRKYLNYEESIRANVKQTNLLLAMTRDSEDLVRLAFLQSFSLCEAVGRLIFFLLYQLVLLVLSQQGMEMVVTTIFLTVILPVGMILFLATRQKKTVAAKKALDRSQVHMLTHVNHTVSNCRLIMDYHLRPQAVEKHEERVNEYNNAELEYVAVMKTNSNLPPKLTLFVLALFTLIGGMAVSNGTMSIGQFLAFCSIFRQVGNILAQVYNDLLSIQQAFTALEHITRYMNFPIDVLKRRDLNRQRRKVGLEEHQSQRERLSRSSTFFQRTGSKQKFAADHMIIRVKDLSFDHAWDVNNEDSFGAGLLYNCNFEANQGSLVTFIGPRGEGKTTLLKIMGGVLLADAGEVFIPPQLRVFHVSADALFIEGTLMENLILGCLSPTDVDAQEERIVKICQSIGLPDTVTQLIHSNEVRNWAEVLSLSERQLLHFARGLVANPEMLVVHKPTLMFDDKTGILLLKALRIYVDEKGVEQDRSQKALRRPRTCFCTVNRSSGVEIADKVMLVSKQGTRQIPKEEVTDIHMH